MVLPTSTGHRQSGPSHIIPLTDCLGNIDIMRHVFQAAPMAAPRPGG
jgi:hypothetical protein